MQVSEEARYTKPGMRRNQVASPHRLAHLVYLNRMSRFPVGPMFMGDGTQPPAVRLRKLQRAVGVVEGWITDFDGETCCGKVEVGGYQFGFVDHRSKGLREWQPMTGALGQRKVFSFWPTLRGSNLQQGLIQSPGPAITELKIKRVRQGADPPAGYVEVVGQLARLWPEGFAVQLWSLGSGSFIVPFRGNYPTMSHLKQFVWVVGRFDPAIGQVRVEETEAIQFVPRERARALLEMGSRME